MMLRGTEHPEWRRTKHFAYMRKIIGKMFAYMRKLSYLCSVLIKGVPPQMLNKY